MASERKIKLTANGNKAIALKAPAGLPASYEFILPEDPGTAGYQLATDGDGNLSWVPPGGSEEFAQVILLGQGPLILNDADDSASVSIRAPAVLNETYVLTLPAELPAVSGFLQVDDQGVISFAAGSADLQTAYDSGEEVLIADGTPITLTGDDPSGTLLVLLGDDDATDPLLEITDAGTGGALSIVQSGNAPGLTVAKAGGAAAIVAIAGSDAISGDGLSLDMPAAGSGIGLDLANAGSGIGARFGQATTAAVLAQFNQGTNAIGLDINKTGAGAGNAIDVDDDGTGVALAIVKDGAGLALSVTQNAAAALATLTQTQAGQVGLTVAKTGAGAGVALLVDNDGTGDGIHIEQDGAGSALVIDQDGAATAAIINQSQNAIGLAVLKTGAGAGAAAYIENDGSGIGLQVVQDGDAVACSIAAAAASGEAVLQLTHLSADPFPDVLGTSSSWHVTNKGAAFFDRIAVAVETYTIAAGAITLNGGGTALVAGEGGVADNLDEILSDSGNPVQPGTVIVIRAADDADTITVRSGVANIHLNAGGNRSLDNARDTLVLHTIDGIDWDELSFSSNGG